MHLTVRGQSDVERARRAARAIAFDVGFRGIDIDAIVLATSELATNLVRYACEGELIMRAVADTTRSGMSIESRDAGPGIADLPSALRGGASTGGGLGGGLPGVRRLMDTFAIETGPGGTTIVASKWLER